MRHCHTKGAPDFHVKLLSWFPCKVSHDRKSLIECNAWALSLLKNRDTFKAESF